MEHQFNLGPAVQPPPFIPRNDPEAPMYASVDGVAAALSNEEVVFQPRGTATSQVMTHQVLQCLDRCRAFRSLDEHIARIIREVPGLADPSRARQGLDALVRAGLLQSDRQFTDGLRAEPRPVVEAAGVCVRACDRPAQLGRLLDSLADNEARFGAQRPLLLVDDSRDATAARDNEDLVKAYARRAGVAVHYVGSRERQKLLKQVRRALPDAAEGADWLLQQPEKATGGGAAWNVAMLLTAGRCALMFDEDFELPLRRHALSRDGINLTPQAQPFARFHESLSDAVGSGEGLDEDGLATHLACLGQPLGALMQRRAYALDRQSLRGLELGRLQKLYGGARVLSTMNGTRGAHGSDAGQWLYLLDADSRADLCRDRDAYIHNVELQSLWYGHAQAHPGEQSFFTPFALDNRELLPCTTPDGRGEDALFGTLLRLCHPQSVAFNLPLTIGHVQERARRRASRTLQAQTPGFVAFAYETLQNHFDTIHASDPARRLRMGADLLQDIAEGDEQWRVNLLHEYLNYVRADLIARLQGQLAAVPDAPVYWRTDVLEIITANARAMIQQPPPRLGNWPADVDPATSARLLSEQLQTLSRGLRAWPSLRAWADERGDRLLASL
ncbi:MAG TPA: hypothetical protein VFG73_09940 [Rhodanobacteraceae bacterium]|nr:hypothetical protein [Rhodanobacteraceae bacterium]